MTFPKKVGLFTPENDRRGSRYAVYGSYRDVRGELVELSGAFLEGDKRGRKVAIYADGPNFKMIPKPDLLTPLNPRRAQAELAL